MSVVFRQWLSSARNREVGTVPLSRMLTLGKGKAGKE